MSNMTVGQSNEWLKATPTIEAAHPDVAAFAHRHTEGASTDVERAVKLFYAVRDGVRYDPYQIELTVQGQKASTTLATGRGWCVSKAVLLAAGCRALGIAARLGFADVRNHLTTARLRRQMGTDLFLWHGYTEIFLGGAWVKATPAFNIELCKKFRLLPLEFDGRSDSLYHPFDAEGRRHMEYVNQRGVYDDLPLAEIVATFERAYGFQNARSELFAESFDRDVAEESGE